MPGTWYAVVTKTSHVLAPMDLINWFRRQDTVKLKKERRERRQARAAVRLERSLQPVCSRRAAPLRLNRDGASGLSKLPAPWPPLAEQLARSPGGLQPEPGRVEALHLQPGLRRVPGVHRQELGFDLALLPGLLWVPGCTLSTHNVDHASDSERWGSKILRPGS